MTPDTQGIMPTLMHMREQGKKNAQAYKGLWTPEALADELDRYFDYCAIQSFKPTIPSLCVWLSISKPQFYEWRNYPEKYGDKSYLINGACAVMESYLQFNIDKYPTGSIFLLKTSHGHVETQKVDITSSTGVATPEELDAALKRLGLAGKTKKESE